MLGSHSQVLSPPEPWLLLPLVGLWDQRVLATAPFDYSFAARAIDDLLKPEQLDEALVAFASTAYNALLDGSGKRILVDKTPRYYHILGALQRLFPDALELWIRRNPLATVASCMETWKLPLEELIGEIISPYTFDVTVSFRLLADHFAAHAPNKFALKYEDLVASPERSLVPICELLGLNFEPSMLEYGRNTLLMQSYQHATMGDKKVLHSASVHTASVDAWRSTLEPHQVARILQTLGTRIFVDMGYSEELAQAAEYANIATDDIEPDGALPRVFAAYEAYGRSVGSEDELAGVSGRTDVQYTLLGQQNADLQRAADERLRLVQRLDRQLTDIRADADAKERVIVELRDTVLEQRRVLDQLEQQQLGLDSSPDTAPEDQEAFSVRESMAAHQRLLEQIITNLQTAAEERLKFIERLEQQGQELRLALAEKDRLIATLRSDKTAPYVPATAADQAQPVPSDDVRVGRLTALVSSLEAALTEQVDAFGRLTSSVSDASALLLDARKEASASLQVQVEKFQREAAVAQAAAEARLAIINEQQRAIERYRRWHPRDVISRWTAPRIGQLYQYSPRAMVIPERYLQTPPVTRPPIISIVTPTFNQGSFIERTIKSIVGQQYPRLEYIVKDAGSSDETLDILKRYEPKISHIESAPDSGFASGINQGFAHATGEIMAYVNSDDLLLPGTLQYVAKFFAENNDVDLVYGHRVIIDEYDAEIGRWVLPGHDDEVLSWADYVPQETMFWRAELWRKVGASIDESFRFAIDWDLLIRFRDAGARMRRLPRFLGAFRVHPHQKTSMQMQEIGQQEMDRLRERCHGRSVTVDEIDRALRPYLRRHFVHHKFYRMGILRY